MDRIRRYIECYIPTEMCNLRCHYCYITQKRKFNNKHACFSKSKETIRKALSKERLGGVCLLNMCAGGETLLSGEVLPVVREILDEGHYVAIVTNGTVTQRFEEIAQWPTEILKRLFIKFSFHYLELVRLGWLDRYFENVQLMKQAGVSITVEITPSDELIPHIPDIKQICMDKLGTLCHVTIARDDRTNGIEVLSQYGLEEYAEIWGTFQSELLEFKKTIFYKKRNEFCYAGDWSIYLNLDTGNYRQCYVGKSLGNIFEDISKPLHFETIGCECTLPHCYNGHAFLTLGCIPQLQTPTYAQMRDRTCADGSHWLQPDMAAFMSTKLSESNQQYSAWKKGKRTVRKLYHSLYRTAGRFKSLILGKR